MPDFTRGKVYRITSGNLTYIGSTTEPTLAKRLAKHVGNYKVWKNGKTNSCSSFQLIETGQYEITLIELCPCGSRDEMTARERFHIENTVCVNKHIPGQTYQEWYADNKRQFQKKRRPIGTQIKLRLTQDDGNYIKHENLCCNVYESSETNQEGQEHFTGRKEQV